MNNYNVLKKIEYICPIHHVNLSNREQFENEQFVGECGCIFKTIKFDGRSIPIFINEELQDTVFDESFLNTNRQMNINERPSFSYLRNVYSKLRSNIENLYAKPYTEIVTQFVQNRESSLNPSCLIVGSGNRSLPSSLGDLNIDVIGFDLFLGSNVDFIADAHYLPLPQRSFDIVFVQAVLEHVVQPDLVVNEIHRILKPGGIVISEAPFLQAIHEGAYDFYRYTPSAHAALFNKFEILQVGPLVGVVLSFVWSLRGLLSSFIGIKFAKLLCAPFFIIAQLIPVKKNKHNWDYANSSFYVGKKEKKLNENKKFHKKVLEWYEN